MGRVSPGGTGVFETSCHECLLDILACSRRNIYGVTPVEVVVVAAETFALVSLPLCSSGRILVL
jgi:hypothetical protein